MRVMRGVAIFKRIGRSVQLGYYTWIDELRIKIAAVFLNCD